ncbi:MAG: fused MFS/spermidine synthase [Bacteroidetes bacterium]|nr:fused MFS/spermidine synthase [Bacteroidota bacterium]
MLRKFLFLSFIEGAAVMAAELCGAKLLAPIFGSSLYVWASVMGITLAALASGYFFGGSNISTKNNPTKKLYYILIAASLFLMVMPLIGYYLVPRISYLGFMPAVILSTIALIFFPVFFLGASSPLFIVLQTHEKTSAGKVSGTVYAISTLGGILATFICGFFLIPVIGLSYTLLLFGSILFLSTLFCFKTLKVAQLLLFISFIYLNFQFTLLNNSAIMNSDGILGHLEVKDLVSNKRQIRLLKINNIIQTEMDLVTRRSVSGYVSLFDTLVSYSQKPKQALVLGLGGGLTANLLTEKNYDVTGVEFDERIIEASEKYFFLDKKIKTVCEDARYYLNHCDKKFDLILFDVFKAEEQPGHVITIESLTQIKRNLKNGSVMYINWHGYTNEKLGLGTSVLYNTLIRSGFNVTLCSLSKDENYRNIIFVCKNVSINSEESATEIPYKINDKLVSLDVINTDDKPVLERYNALANKTWRTNYLRYYQNN